MANSWCRSSLNCTTYVSYVQIWLIFVSTSHCMDLCLTILGSFYLRIFCCTRFNLIFWALHYCFHYVNSKLLCLNPGVLEWERISLKELGLFIWIMLFAYQIDRSNWRESCYTLYICKYMRLRCHCDGNWLILIHFVCRFVLRVLVLTLYYYSQSSPIVLLYCNKHDECPTQMLLGKNSLLVLILCSVCA